MHLVSQLRRILAMMIVLLGLLAGLGVASALSDAPILTGGLQTPSVAEQTPRHSLQQRNQHPTAHTITADTFLTIKHHDTKPKHPVIADRNA
ncbi:hypothetical protein [Bifidobacterium sp. ESL0822]|uniref:hypothetical protein n=1 Tax=Bifidobacterium sp. ESL0822 TaxID=3448585 RepID=UPI004042116A